MEYWHDEPIWTEKRKILTPPKLSIPGLEMFGHSSFAHSRNILTSHRHECTEFLYLANGSQGYNIAGKEYVLRGGQLLIVDEDTPHSSGLNPYGRYEALWFRLNVAQFAHSLGISQQAGEILTNSLRQMDNPVITLGEKPFAELLDCFFRLASEDVGNQLIGYGEFIRFVTGLVEYTTPAAGCSPCIARVLEYIAQNITVHLILEELAGQAGLSLSGFKQKFKRETGISPREYINLQKIKKAKEMLAEGVSVTETAFALDFSSSSYFSVLFRQMENMSPVEYVKRMKN